MSALSGPKVTIGLTDFALAAQPFNPDTGEGVKIDLRDIISGAASTNLKKDFAAAFDLPAAKTTAAVAQQGKIVEPSKTPTYDELRGQNLAMENKYMAETIEAGLPKPPASPAKQPVVHHNYLADQVEKRKKKDRAGGNLVVL